MQLVTDIGNTDIVLGFYRNGQWLPSLRIPTLHSPNAADYHLLVTDFLQNQHLQQVKLTQAVLSSVVPGETALVRQLIRQCFSIEPKLIGPEIYPLLGMEIPSPREIGTDLIANAFYAWKTYGEPCIVTDFGTALTFTVVNTSGIAGVSIAPGLRTALRALHANTAQLPQVPLQMPLSAIGRNTVHAMQAGTLWGYVGLVKEMLTRIQEEAGPCRLLATGGLVQVLTPVHELFQEIDINLTLNGLRLISEQLHATPNAPDGPQ